MEKQLFSVGKAGKAGGPAAHRRQLLSIGIAFVLAVASGLLLSRLAAPAVSNAVSEQLLSPLLDLYLRAMKLLVSPLVFFSLIACIISFNDLSQLGRIGGRVLLAYLLTTVCAVLLGLGAFYALRPADHAGQLAAAAYSAPAQVMPTLKSILLAIVPGDLISPFVEANMLQITFLALVCGIGLLLLGERARLLGAFCRAANELMIKLATLLVKLAPLATYCAITRLLITVQPDMLLALLRLLLTVACGMLAMLLVYCLLLAAARLDPRRFLRKFAGNFLIAFALNSASATVPVTLATCEDRLGVSPRVSRFSIPLGATINMDGSCVYLCVTALFLAQLYGVTLDHAAIAAMAVSVFLLSIGAPGVPGSGLVCLSMLVLQIDVPLEAVGLVVGVDKLFGMMRSATNVTGDAALTTLVAAQTRLLDRDVYNA